MNSKTRAGERKLLLKFKLHSKKIRFCNLKTHIEFLAEEIAIL